MQYDTGSYKISPTRETANNRIPNRSFYGNKLLLTVTFGRVDILLHPLFINNRINVKPFPFRSTPRLDRGERQTKGSANNDRRSRMGKERGTIGEGGGEEREWLGWIIEQRLGGCPCVWVGFPCRLFACKIFSGLHPGLQIRTHLTLHTAKHVRRLGRKIDTHGKRTVLSQSRSE